jgi:hypothetical protein
MMAKPISYGVDKDQDNSPIDSSAKPRSTRIWSDVLLSQTQWSEKDARDGTCWFCLFLISHSYFLCSKGYSSCFCTIALTTSSPYSEKKGISPHQYPSSTHPFAPQNNSSPQCSYRWPHFFLQSRHSWTQRALRRVTSRILFAEI